MKVTKKEFKIFEKVFTVSEERVRYNMYRNLYKGLADKAMDMFGKIYMKEMHSMDTIHMSGYESGMRCIEQAVKKSVDILVENKIYDIDEEIFFNKYFSRYNVWDKAFDSVDDRYLSIVYSAEEAREYREARKDARGRFVGGGFGIGGAIKGSLQAGAMNMATGMAYGVLNYFENRATEKRMNREKQELFEDQRVYTTMADGVWNSVFFMQYALYDIIGHLDGAEWDIVGDEEEAKVKSLLKNLPRVQKKEERGELLLQCLQLDPYNMDIYEAIVEENALNIGEFGKICGFFSVNLKGLLAPVLKGEIENCKKTEQAVLACKERVVKKMEEYGVTDESFLDDVYGVLEKALTKEYNDQTKQLKNPDDVGAYQEKMIQRINEYQKERPKFAQKFKEKIDKEVRTYDGTVYKTREEKAQVIKNDEDIKKKFSEIKQMSDEQIDSLCKELKSEKHSESCKNYCRKVVEHIYDERLKKECEKIDTFSEKELSDLEKKIKNGMYSNSCQNRYLDKIKEMRNKFELEKAMNAVNKDDLGSINAALNGILSTKNISGQVKNVLDLLRMQSEFGAELYKEELDKFYSGVKWFTQFDSLYFNGKDSKIAVKAVRYIMDKQLAFEEEEVLLLFYESNEEKSPSYLITNKRVIDGNGKGYSSHEINRNWEITENLLVFQNIKDGKGGFAKISWPVRDVAEETDPELKRKMQALIYVKKGVTGYAVVADRMKDFLGSILDKNRELQERKVLLEQLSKASEQITSLSKTELIAEYEKWIKRKVEGKEVAEYIDKVEEALKIVYKREASSLCSGLEEMSIGQLEELVRTLNREFKDARFSYMIEDEKNAVKNVLLLKQEEETRQEIQACSLKVSQLSKEELEAQYEKWTGYNGTVNEVKEFLQSLEENLGKKYKADAEELSRDLESMTVEELKELVKKFDEEFCVVHLRHFVETERSAAAEELKKKQEQALKNDILEKTQTIVSLSKEEMESEYAAWNDYEGNVDEVREYVKSLMSALEAAYQKEMEAECDHLESLSVIQLRNLVKKIELKYKDNQFVSETLIKEAIGKVQSELEKKQEREIKEWYPEKTDTLSIQELEALLRKFNEGNYDTAFSSKYEIPLLEQRNNRIVGKAEEMNSFIHRVANDALKTSYIMFETREVMLNSLREYPEDDIMICSIGTGANACKVFLKKLVFPKTNISMDFISRFEMKKKLLGCALVCWKKNGGSEEINMHMPPTELKYVADLLSEVVYHAGEFGADFGVGSIGTNVNRFSESNVQTNRVEKEDAKESVTSFEENIMKQVAKAVEQGIEEVKYTKTEGASSIDELCRLMKDKCTNLYVNQPSEVFSVYRNSSKFEKKIANALKKYVNLSGDQPLLLFDSTIFENGKEGFVISDKYFYYNFYGTTKGTLRLNEICEFVVKKKGKDDVVYMVKVNGEEMAVIPVNVADGVAERRCEFLNYVLQVIKN